MNVSSGLHVDMSLEDLGVSFDNIQYCIVIGDGDCVSGSENIENVPRITFGAIGDKDLVSLDAKAGELIRDDRGRA